MNSFRYEGLLTKVNPRYFGILPPMKTSSTWDQGYTMGPLRLYTDYLKWDKHRIATYHNKFATFDDILAKRGQYTGIDNKERVRL